MKCLLVDQSATRRRIFRQSLHDRTGVDFLEASSVPRALELAADGVDLVMTDWNLVGDQSGIDLLKALRGTSTDLPIIMVTARNRREDVASAVEAGVTSYVMRPFSPEVLRAHVLPLVENRE